MAKLAQGGQSTSPSSSLEPSAITGFDAVNYSQSRGYVYFPQLDTRKEITSFSRKEILKKSRYLYNNVGFTRRILRAVARMVVGKGIWPQAMTKDKEWNALAEQAFRDRAMSPKVLDVGERYSWPLLLNALVKVRHKDGDVFPVLAKSAMGRARVQLYEAHQFGGGDEDAGWHDGVKLDRNNRAIKYRLLQGGDSFRDLSSTVVLAQIDYDRIGQSRGVSSLVHAINNMLDTTEILSYLKQGVKLTNQIGYYFKKSRSGIGPSLNGLSGNARQKEKEGADGKKDKYFVEQVLSGVKVPELSEDEELKLLESSKPHPNELGLLEYLVRDISWGMDLSPELLWNIAKVGSGGQRFILQDAQSFVDLEGCLLVSQFCRPFWLYFLATEMQAGVLRRPRDPQWWKHSFVMPRRMTVDRGREGKLNIDLNRRGMLTLAEYYGEDGKDWEEQVEQFVLEKKRIKEIAEENDMELSEVMPPEPGSAAMVGDDGKKKGDDEREENEEDVDNDDGEEGEKGEE